MVGDEIRVRITAPDGKKYYATSGETLEVSYLAAVRKLVMKTCTALESQSGYVLLLAVLALMGLGGVVLVGFTQEAKQDADQERYLHNKRVLEEAKQELLMICLQLPGK